MGISHLHVTRFDIYRTQQYASHRRQQQSLTQPLMTKKHLGLQAKARGTPAQRSSTSSFRRSSESCRSRDRRCHLRESQANTRLCSPAASTSQHSMHFVGLDGANAKVERSRYKIAVSIPGPGQECRTVRQTCQAAKASRIPVCSTEPARHLVVRLRALRARERSSLGEKESVNRPPASFQH